MTWFDAWIWITIVILYSLFGLIFAIIYTDKSYYYVCDKHPQSLKDYIVYMCCGPIMWIWLGFYTIITIIEYLVDLLISKDKKKQYLKNKVGKS